MATDDTDRLAQIAVRLPAALRDRINLLAALRGMTQEELVNRLLAREVASSLPRALAAQQAKLDKAAS